MRAALTALLLLLATAPFLRADRVAEIAGIHLAVIGGRERVEALRAFRATGYVLVGRDEMRFALLAARPNRVRIETERAGRKSVQGTDGERPPWEYEGGVRPGRARLLSGRAARTFMADAEFDDPLVAGTARGYAIDYAGAEDVAGRACWRFLVTRRAADPVSVLLDRNTYLVAAKREERSSALGRKLQVVTAFDDYRPVAGVLLPHHVTTTVDGRPTQEIRIVQIEANPVLPADAFLPPAIVISRLQKH